VEDQVRADGCVIPITFYASPPAIRQCAHSSKMDPIGAILFFQLFFSLCCSRGSLLTGPRPSPRVSSRRYDSHVEADDVQVYAVVMCSITKLFITCSLVTF
jgi:hypothetical protein